MIINKFRIDIFGDLEYEELVADIYYEDQVVAVFTQESGFENLQIEIYPPKSQEFWCFKFSEFEEAIYYAKNRLEELRKLPEEDTENDPETQMNN